MATKSRKHGLARPISRPSYRFGRRRGSERCTRELPWTTIGVAALYLGCLAMLNDAMAVFPMTYCIAAGGQSRVMPLGWELPGRGGKVGRSNRPPVDAQGAGTSEAVSDE